MTTETLNLLIRKGITAADEGHTLVGLLHLEDAAKQGRTPMLLSYLGYCAARERRQFNRGLALCKEAIGAEPNQSQHYLNMGRIYLEAGQKNMAIKTFRQGLKLGKNRQIADELRQLGLRKSPVFASLPRDNPLNRIAGKILSRLGMR